VSRGGGRGVVQHCTSGKQKLDCERREGETSKVGKTFILLLKGEDGAKKGGEEEECINHVDVAKNDSFAEGRRISCRGKVLLEGGSEREVHKGEKDMLRVFEGSSQSNKDERKENAG